MPGFSINPQLLVLSRGQTAGTGKTIRNYSYFFGKSAGLSPTRALPP
jgi:hypothetical protein